MRRTNSDKGSVPKKGTLAIPDLVGQVSMRGRSGAMPLPFENVRLPRPSCARLRKPTQEILNPLRVTITPGIDLTRYLQLAWHSARWFYHDHRGGGGVCLDDLAGDPSLFLVGAAVQFAPTRRSPSRTSARKAFCSRCGQLPRRPRRHPSLEGADGRMREPEARPMPDPDA